MNIVYTIQYFCPIHSRCRCMGEFKAEEFATIFKLNKMQYNILLRGVHMSTYLSLKLKFKKRVVKLNEIKDKLYIKTIE